MAYHFREEVVMKKEKPFEISQNNFLKLKEINYPPKRSLFIFLLKKKKMFRRIYFDFEIVEFSGSHSDPIIQISCPALR